MMQPEAVGASMRLFFINRYYWPDESATSLMLTDLAGALAAAGDEVHVVTSRQLLDRPDAGLAASATHAGVHIHRLAGTRFGRARLLLRALDYLSFYLAALLFLLRRLRAGDVVVAKTDPPLMGVVAALATRLRRARLIHWLQDVYPEIACRLGALRESGLPARLLRALRDHSLRHAAATVVVGTRMAQQVGAATPPGTPPQVIGNWSAPLETSEVPADDHPLRQAHGLHGKTVFAYSGNLGRAHDISTLLDAGEQLRGHPRIHFMMIGAGAQLADLRAEVGRRGLAAQWRFLPYQPREQLAQSLGAADVHLVTLHPAMEGLVVPSKFYGVCAAGRPTLFVGAADGEIPRLLHEHGCGLAVAAGDAAALADACRQLDADPALRRRLGQAARRAATGPLAFEQRLRQWQQLLAANRPR
jgi:colanic acid biosynthesis glycosyl transferase WcaI